MHVCDLSPTYGTVVGGLMVRI